jgi:hypothetical protein
LDEGGRVIAFEGPPWKNPNFVAYTEDDAVADLSQEELESILREHYQGGRGCYVLGSYIAEKDDVHNFTLPRFHCADKTTLAERPENQKGRDWKDILPVWQNQSLLSQQAKEKKHAVAGEMERRNGRDEISLFRALRRYEPREHHLRDAQGET